VLGGHLPRTRLFWIGAGVLVVFLAVATVFGYRMSRAQELQSVPFSTFLENVT